RTYRVLREFDIPDLKTTIINTPSALAPAVEENLPAVEKAIRVNLASPIVEYGPNKFVETSFIFAEEGFFELFSFPVTEGEVSLHRPSTIVITEEMSTKYFPQENPLGKTLRVGNTEMEVTGVIANVPENSHLQFGFVASLKEPELNWGLNNFITYLLLQSGHSKDLVSQQIADLIQANTDPYNERDGNDFIPYLQPVEGIHLGQGVSVNIGSQGNILYVYLFISLAVFIVLLACINFMNMATARSAERAREVGMRKTLGSNRSQIALQFLGESVTTSLFALFLALALSQLTLPFLNDLSGKSLEFSSLTGGIELITIIGFTLLVGIITGLYPAFVLSGFKPSQAVKGIMDNGSGYYLRKGLVVFQFTISISLLVATGVVYQQLEFMKGAGLGFNEEN
ncbi:MAG: FtsX-like permease family protein, partial [Salibacteraceae bacterium]